ncbi:hypothetical protein EOI86_06575 [Hwanghaeella grinnelliae]|uniref:Uncharacterized protein n=1 Tax=Hwanghaeella grinnelliae TaxID=2500179 RepID=A0A3S2VQ02_9PROT|nr:hypothetical protein [Hwanghaeella grinnelliae]RVU38924.1 hypothetical protein EOI86_06575 [Hwanghaeella grinnelliae]
MFFRTSLVAMAAVLTLAAPAAAQNVDWKLLDSGVLVDTAHGKGVEMRIQPEPMVDGLFDSPEIGRIMVLLCNHYVPYVLPYVTEKFDMDKADFISVRLLSGGAVFGRYIQEFYAVSDDGCGAAL